jgi:hypothetical protein
MEVLKVVMGRSNHATSLVGEIETGEIVDAGRADTSTSSAGWGRWGGVGEGGEDRMDVGDGCGAEDMDVRVEKPDEGKDGEDLGEDRRVLSAALAAVCNIVNDFSPLRPVSSFKFFFLGTTSCRLELFTVIFLYPLGLHLPRTKVNAAARLYTAPFWRLGSSS